MLAALMAAAEKADADTLKKALAAFGISDSVTEVAAGIQGEDEKEVVETEAEAEQEGQEEDVAEADAQATGEEEAATEPQPEKDDEQETVAESKGPTAQAILESVASLNTAGIEPTETLLLAMAGLPDGKARESFAAELAENLALESIPHAMRSPKSKQTPRPNGKAAETKTPDPDKKYARFGSLAEIPRRATSARSAGQRKRV